MKIVEYRDSKAHKNDNAIKAIFEIVQNLGGMLEFKKPIQCDLNFIIYSNDIYIKKIKTIQFKQDKSLDLDTEIENRKIALGVSSHNHIQKIYNENNELIGLMCMYNNENELIKLKYFDDTHHTAPCDLLEKINNYLNSDKI